LKKLTQKDDKIKNLEKEVSGSKDSLFNANSESAKARDELQKTQTDYESLKKQHD